MHTMYFWCQQCYGIFHTLKSVGRSCTDRTRSDMLPACWNRCWWHCWQVFYVYHVSGSLRDGSFDKWGGIWLNKSFRCNIFMSVWSIHFLRPPPPKKKSTHQHFLSVKNPMKRIKISPKRIKVYGKNCSIFVCEIWVPDPLWRIAKSGCSPLKASIPPSFLNSLLSYLDLVDHKKIPDNGFGAESTWQIANKKLYMSVIENFHGPLTL